MIMIDNEPFLTRTLLHRISQHPSVTPAVSKNSTRPPSFWVDARPYDTAHVIKYADDVFHIFVSRGNTAFETMQSSNVVFFSRIAV